VGGVSGVKILENQQYLESVKQNLLSGEWFLLVGDAECTLSLVAMLKTVVHVLMSDGHGTILLVKKTENFHRVLGVSEEIAKQVVGMFMTSVEDACLTNVFFTEKEDIKERVIGEIIEKLRQLAEDIERRERGGDRNPASPTM
jgi:hypothetical protein